MSQSELVTVYRSQGMPMAEAAKAKLEGAGIPVSLEYDTLGQILGMTRLGLVEVKVPEAWAAEARTLLSEITDSGS